MLTATVAFLLLAAPAPTEPDPYAHPVTGKRIENVPKVVIAAKPKRDECFCCLATIALHQGIKLDRENLDAYKNNNKRLLDRDTTLSYFEAHDIKIVRVEGREKTLAVLESVAKDKRIVSILARIKPEVERTVSAICPWYYRYVHFMKPGSGRGMGMVCVLYVDPKTVKDEERYVCILDPVRGVPEWFKYDVFINKRLRQGDQNFVYYPE